MFKYMFTPIRGCERLSLLSRAWFNHLSSLWIVPERVHKLPDVPLRKSLLSKPHRLGPLVGR